ncbi:hypothetical protein OPQ81_004084 [Rhizoctonia solani]|nr:hypothetical protein OPQ81_004084 [Rhizoctonia solani]
MINALVNRPNHVRERQVLVQSSNKPVYLRLPPLPSLPHKLPCTLWSRYARHHRRSLQPHQGQGPRLKK